MKLDYNLTTPEERIAYVNKILEKQKIQDYKTLEYLSNYILFVADKNQTKKEHKETHPIVTRNRDVTVNKRQISFEEIVSNLENGEDGLYALITNDKNQIMDPKQPITQEDIEEIPGMRDNFKLLESLKSQLSRAAGAAKYSIKKQIIETWQQIYMLKASFRAIPMRNRTANAQIKSLVHADLSEKITFDEEGCPQSDGKISLFNPAHVSFLLCYYPKLKQECYEEFQSDMFYLLLDLENLVIKVLLPEHEQLFDLLVWKIDGKTNEEIQALMESKYGVIHNNQYFSTLWRKKIPRLIAKQAQKDYLEWYYTNEEYGNWKKCGKCGKMKLAHPLFFPKNSSKDGFYSICKECHKGK